MTSQSVNLGRVRSQSSDGRARAVTVSGIPISPRSPGGTRAPPGRSQTVALPPSFERPAAPPQTSFSQGVRQEYDRFRQDPGAEARRIVQGAEQEAYQAYQGVRAGVQAIEARTEAAFRPNTAPTRPAFVKSATVSWDTRTGPVQSRVPAKPATAPMVSLYIEPGSTAIYVMVASALMMTFACWMPFYLGVCMLWDVHYRMWVTWSLPALVVFASVVMPVAFVGTIYIILGRGHGSGVRTEETMVLIGATFASLLGVVLCLLALPMSTSAAGTVSRLSFGCDLADPVSAPLVQYSQVLHNIRNTPECQAMGSVKDCPGWKANKYTEYLARIEQDFDCTGLCTLPAPPTAPPAASTPKVAPHANSGQVPQGQGVAATTGPQDVFLQQHGRSLNTNNQTVNSQLQTEAEARTTTSSDAIPALMLYSKDKTDERCYPLIADRLQVISGTTGELLFWQGVGLLFVSVMAGATKVVDKTLFEK